MNQQINDMIRRTQRYWYVDGLTEIGSGLIILLLGLFDLALAALPPQTPTAVLVAVGQPLLIIGGTLLISKIVRMLKERITFPRTGYVEYPEKRRGKRRAALALVAGLIAAGIFVLIDVLLNISANLIPVIVAVLLAISFALIGYRFGLTRFYLVAVFCLAAGLVISRYILQELQQSGLFFTALGLVWIVSGTIVLVQYLRSTQPTREEP